MELFPRDRAPQSEQAAEPPSLHPTSTPSPAPSPPTPVPSASDQRLERLEERLHRLEQQLAASHGTASDHGVQIPLDEQLEPPRSLNFSLDDLLRTVIKNRASDLHIKPFAPPTVRLEGKLVPIGDRPLTPEESNFLVLSALPPRKRMPLTHLREVDHAHSAFGVRFRLNAFLERGNLSAAFRMINTSVPRFHELGLPPVLERLASLHDGLVLITGPAGSGKSTTLASVVDWINDNRRSHIVTIEDPIEFHHQDRTAYISQREVGTDTTSFMEALKQALRQDPNVIMLGEMRDSETIMTAVTAAETGHLVISTLHTPNTVQAIDRIVDSFSGQTQKQVRMLLASCLRGVVSQKLLNRADGRGRIPAVEVLINTPTIASHILDGQTHEIYQYIQRGESEGMQTFTQSLISLLDRGLITYQDAAQVADRKNELRLASEQRRRTAPPGVPRRAPVPEPTQPAAGDLLDLL
jgi:twitching motility protein PilT